MPKIPAERLSEIGRALFVAAGTPPEEAETVMRHVVAANLAGHDSHGVIQIPTYIERIKVGHIVPGAPWKIVQESPTTTVVDGHWGFGYVVNERAMRLTIEKAERRGGDGLSPGPYWPARELHPDGGEGRYGRADHRGFRALPKSSGAVWRARGAARHQSDLDRDAVRSRRAALPRHGDLGRRGREDRAVGRPRYAGAAGLDYRSRRQAHHRSEPAPPGWRPPP